MGGEKYDQIAPQAITQIEKNLKQLDELHGIQTLKQINTDLKGSKLKSVQHKLEKIQRQKTLYNTNHEYINRTNQSQNSEINQMNKGRFVHKCYYQSKNFVAKHDGVEHFYSLNHQDLTQRNPIANYEDTMHHPDCFKTRFKTKKQTLDQQETRYLDGTKARIFGKKSYTKFRANRKELGDVALTGMKLSNETVDLYLEK